MLTPSDPIFLSSKKLNRSRQAVLWNFLNDHPGVPSSQVLIKMASIAEPIPISIRHLNRIRAKWRFSRGKGRPTGSKNIVKSNCNCLKIIPNLSSAGLHIFAEWMESNGEFNTLLNLLNQAVESLRETHPDASFPLLHHRDDTLLCRFKAFFFAPLMGIGKLTEFDYQEHSLPTLIGRNYQSSTLTQYLGQLERINAGKILMNVLKPLNSGNICYIDGHMIGFWTKISMHKGKITMLGRIMAGSQAVVAHNENGHALYAEYYPPDIRLTRIIVDYCRQIANTSGIDLFVIDREINSEAIAAEFEANEWGLLSMLDKNQYKNLDDWKYEFAGHADGFGNVYQGVWKDEKQREKDPRHFVIVENDGRLLPYWGTSRIKKALKSLEWPQVYANRTEIQENSFKRMKKHGALEVNYGIKKIYGPDRHQERAKEKYKESLKNITKRLRKNEEKIVEQTLKVKESEGKKHGKRLKQRRKKLGVLEEKNKKIKNKEKNISGQLEKSDPARERADRDFRKQLIMTIRTLFLENSLMVFLNCILETANIQMGLDTFTDMFFKRMGSYMETTSEIIYWINIKGLSKAYKKKIKKIVEALNALKMDREGKSIQIQIREAPT